MPTAKIKNNWQYPLARLGIGTSYRDAESLERGERIEANQVLFAAAFPAVRVSRCSRAVARVGDRFAESYPRGLEPNTRFWDHVGEMISRQRSDPPYYGTGYRPAPKGLTYRAQVLHPYLSEDRVREWVDARRDALDAWDLGVRLIPPEYSWYYPGGSSTVFVGPRWDLYRIFESWGDRDYVRVLHGNESETETD